jgi:hypothetical protein
MPDAAVAEESAGVRIFNEHRDRLRGVAYRVLGRINDVEDVVQDTWLRWSAVPWLPEPMLTGPDVADSVALADSVSTAMLLVLEALSPLERAVFVLREAFRRRTPRPCRRGPRPAGRRAGPRPSGCSGCTRERRRRQPCSRRRRCRCASPRHRRTVDGWPKRTGCATWRGPCVSDCEAQRFLPQTPGSTCPAGLS